MIPLHEVIHQQQHPCRAHITHHHSFYFTCPTVKSGDRIERITASRSTTHIYLWKTACTSTGLNIGYCNEIPSGPPILSLLSPSHPDLLHASDPSFSSKNVYLVHSHTLLVYLNLVTRRTLLNGTNAYNNRYCIFQYDARCTLEASRQESIHLSKAGSGVRQQWTARSEYGGQNPAGCEKSRVEG